LTLKVPRQETEKEMFERIGAAEVELVPVILELGHVIVEVTAGGIKVEQDWALPQEMP
jgi:hypothetical protein